MKKYNGNIRIIVNDDHVVLTSKRILKQYFENIEILNSPKSFESRLKRQECDFLLNRICNFDSWGFLDHPNSKL